MVGNVDEWVANWQPYSDGCTDWLTSAGFTDGDASCLSNDAASGLDRLPGALDRGGSLVSGAADRVFAVGKAVPSDAFSVIGFRCAR